MTKNVGGTEFVPVPLKGPSEDERGSIVSHNGVRKHITEAVHPSPSLPTSRVHGGPCPS